MTRMPRASLLRPDEAHTIARPDMLRALVPLSPDPARADRVRARCRATLEQRRHLAQRDHGAVGLGPRVLAPAIAGAFCLLYVAALVATALRLR